MCGVYIYGVGCVYSYRGSQTVCLLTNPALPWSPALLPFRLMTSSGRWPLGSRSPMMHLHPDSIKRTLGASGLVPPHQQRGVIPDVEAADRSRCAGIRSEKPPNRSRVVGTEPYREKLFLRATYGACYSRSRLLKTCGRMPRCLKTPPK